MSDEISTDELISDIINYRDLSMQTIADRLQQQQDEIEGLKSEELLLNFTIRQVQKREKQAQVQKREKQAFEAFQDRESKLTIATDALKKIRVRAKACGYTLTLADIDEALKQIEEGQS